MAILPSFQQQQKCRLPRALQVLKDLPGCPTMLLQCSAAGRFELFQPGRVKMALDLIELPTRGMMTGGSNPHSFRKLPCAQTAAAR